MNKQTIIKATTRTKERKVRECYLDIDPYRRRVFIILGSFKEVDARLKKLFDCGVPENTKEAWGAVWRIKNDKTGVSCSIMWMYNLGFDSITHEVFHLTKSVMESADIPLSDATNESWAYFNGWLNEKVIKFVLPSVKRK